MRGRAEAWLGADPAAPPATPLRALPGSHSFVHQFIQRIFEDFGSGGKESAGNTEDPGSVPGSGRSPGEGNGNPLQLFLPGEFRGRRNLMAAVESQALVGTGVEWCSKQRALCPQGTQSGETTNRQLY